MNKSTEFRKPKETELTKAIEALLATKGIKLETYLSSGG